MAWKWSERLLPFNKQADLHGLDAAWLDGPAREPPAADDAAAIERLLARSREAGLLKASLRSEQVRPLLDVCRANVRASAAYFPHPTNGWAALTGQPVEVYEMSTDHYSLLAPPAVTSLADHLRSSIEWDLGVTRPSAPVEPPAAFSSIPAARQ